MKVLLFPTAEGKDWWVLTHDLTLLEGRIQTFGQLIYSRFWHTTL